MKQISLPPDIENIVQEFNSKSDPYSISDVSIALNSARSGFNDGSPEFQAAWRETLAFCLSTRWYGENPWGTYFAPIGSVENQDGNIVYCPDIADADPSIIAHWEARAKALTHPVLVARYADLVWEFGPLVAQSKRDPKIAHLAIDAYLACANAAVYPDLNERIDSAIRGFDLARIIKASDRIDAGRESLMSLQTDAVNTRERWWRVFDRLMNDKNAGLDEAQELDLIQGLEELVSDFSNPSEPETFNPHETKDAADFLIRYYQRKKKPDDVRRLYKTIAEAHEHFANLGDPMIAASALQVAVEAFREAGMAGQVRRTRILMEEKVRASREAMGEFSTEIKIPVEEVEEFCSAIVVDDLGKTFAGFAANFLARRQHVEDILSKRRNESPLSIMFPLQIMDDERVVATVGSIEDDFEGQVIRQAIMNFQISELWLRKALERLLETHAIKPDDLVRWSNRSKIFEDTTFLHEGMSAWLKGDLLNAAHLLAPQAERGLRGIVKQLGMPVTKPNPKMRGAALFLSMGDILRNQDIVQALGPDMTLHFLALYADPRGHDLRNSIAHGSIRSEFINQYSVNLIIHSFMVFGVWKEVAKQHSD